MGAVIIIGVILGLFILLSLYAIIKISGEQSRWEENYRQRKEKNGSTKKTQGK